MTEIDATGSDDAPSIDIATPGIEHFSVAQLVALSELQTDLRASGFDVLLPREERSWVPSPDTALTFVEIYIGQRVGRRLLGKALDDAADLVLDKAKSWAKRQLAKARRGQPDDQPPSTLNVTLYGPDGKPLKTIEVTDGPDGDAEDG